MVDTTSEHARLAAIAAESGYGRGINATSIAYQMRIFSRHWKPGSCLELGSAEGLGTALLVTQFSDLTCVEGAETFCRALRERHPGVTVRCSLFEQYEPQRTFDNIVLGHVLEHVDDPIALLTRVKAWLSPNGRLFASVPNARSLHRQMGVVMDVLTTEHTLNPLDIRHGHRRIYDPESFRRDIRASGLDVEIFGGYWIKPVANAHLEAHWTAEMIDAAMIVGERYPDIAAEIYIVAS